MGVFGCEDRTILLPVLTPLDSGIVFDGGIIADSGIPSDAMARDATTVSPDAGFICPSSDPQIAPICTCDSNGNGIITNRFTDPNLLRAMRNSLGKGPNDDITVQDAIDTTDLHLSRQNIHDLSGVECFTHVTVAWLSQNQISNLTPLTPLVNLSTLWVHDNLPLSDINGLINNTGFSGVNSTVWLTRDTRIPVPQIVALEAKGVAVFRP